MLFPQAVDLDQLHAAFPEGQENSNGNSKENEKEEALEGASLVDDRRLPLYGFTPENINMLLVPMLTNQ